MPPQVHQSISIGEMKAEDIVQIKSGGKIYTLQVVTPRTGEVWLKREHTKRVRGFLLGSLATGDEHKIIAGEIVLGLRIVFQNPAVQVPRDLQALGVTQKVWLNEQIILQN